MVTDVDGLQLFEQLCGERLMGLVLTDSLFAFACGVADLGESVVGGGACDPVSNLADGGGVLQIDGGGEGWDGLLESVVEFAKQQIEIR